MTFGERIFAFFGALWRFVDRSRRATVNIIFLFIVLIVLAALIFGERPHVPGNSALVLQMNGLLVEQLSGDPLQRSLNELSGTPVNETRVQDVLDALNAAADDNRITSVVLDLDSLAGGGLSKLQVVGGALDKFKESGKPVIAVGQFYTQNQYLVAAHADQVFMHPYGGVFLEGYGRYRQYFKSAIDKLDINWHVFRAGSYKSFGEPYMRDDMSPEDRASSKVWIEALWKTYKEDLVAARGLTEDQLDTYANKFGDSLAGQQGDFGHLAVQAGFVDELLTREEMSKRVLEHAALNKKTKTFKQVHYLDYLQLSGLRNPVLATSPNTVGIIVAAGEIIDGSQPPGTVGGDTMAELVRTARLDDNIKAIVLQVDSPGGSVLASEVIRNELELVGAAGKPLIVSMGSIAASGGYWISMPADEIWANAATLTGSIGVIGMFPTFEETLGNLGINTDGIGTTALSGTFRLDRPLSDEGKRIIQLSIDKTYQSFITKVAESRGLDVDTVDSIAGGRVWVGSDAKELGLIDNIGTLADAVDSAAIRAGIGDGFHTRYVEKKLSFYDSLVLKLIGKARALAPKHASETGMLARFVKSLARDLEKQLGFNDPMHQYSHCFCELD